MSGVITINRGWPTPPPEAIAAGYKTLLFFDEFATLSTIDLANTKATGFNWYVSQFANQVVTGPGPGDVSVTAGNLGPTELTLTGLNSPEYPRINSAGYVSKSQYVGTTFSGSKGFLAEAMMSVNPALAQGNGTPRPWPSFWMIDVAYRIADTAPINGGVNGGEIDICECFPTGIGTSQVRMFDFITHLNSDGSQTNLAQGGGPFPGTATITNMNRFGALFIPMSRNGGNGLLRRYCNSIAQPSIDTTWTAGSLFSPLESMNYYIILDGGLVNWPNTFEYVAVWGP